MKTKEQIDYNLYEKQIIIGSMGGLFTQFDNRGYGDNPFYWFYNSKDGLEWGLYAYLKVLFLIYILNAGIIHES